MTDQPKSGVPGEAAREVAHEVCGVSCINRDDKRFAHSWECDRMTKALKSHAEAEVLKAVKDEREKAAKMFDDTVRVYCQMYHTWACQCADIYALKDRIMGVLALPTLKEQSPGGETEGKNG